MGVVPDYVEQHWNGVKLIQLMLLVTDPLLPIEQHYIM